MIWCNEVSCCANYDEYSEGTQFEGVLNQSADLLFGARPVVTISNEYIK